MPQAEQFDALVLGSGQGGKLLAWHLARSGRRTAVVERRWIGGSCSNVACLPSKNEIWSAKVAQLAHHAAQFGTTTGRVGVDMAKVRQRKRDMVAREIAIHLKSFETSGAELVMGSGHFVAPRTVEVRLNGDSGMRLLVAGQVFLNVGTHPAVLDIPGLEAARPLTHIEALELDHLPAHLIVIGGGYVGLELAQAYRRFGSRVTIIQLGPQLMVQEDATLRKRCAKFSVPKGSMFSSLLSPSMCAGPRRGGRVAVATASGERKVEGNDILVAISRVPNTADIGLDETGVELDNRGYIRVNERLETSAPAIWAIGECAGSPHFTHVSVDDFRIIKDNLAGGKRTTRDRLVPYCMFTDPPLAHVGLSEREAQHRGIAVRVVKMPTSAVLRTEATGETQGFMKALISATRT